MSLQAQPQQPAQVYPANSVTNNQPSSHQSNGSFGTVFIVLAIILVISVVACVLGRLCNKRYNNRHSHNPRHSNHHVKPNRQQIHNIHPREVEEEEQDIEYGVEKRMPPTLARPNGNNGHGVGGTGPHHHQPPPNGGNIMKGFEIKHPHHEGDLREVA
ncbi:uncharacterized protein LOC107481326 [Arachis duranensis]|uniref:Uncharacterized protein LOC107481326 n=1 Tax=Arachis duranensis TaxID=130453 RepID=A0A6P4CU17_ARADU|nr:uncharacterized protein LOC107481326 [Arachis duranensis]